MPAEQHSKCQAHLSSQEKLLGSKGIVRTKVVISLLLYESSNRIHEHNSDKYDNKINFDKYIYFLFIFLFFLFFFFLMDK